MIEMPFSMTLDFVGQIPVEIVTAFATRSLSVDHACKLGYTVHKDKEGTIILRT